MYAAVPHKCTGRVKLREEKKTKKTNGIHKASFLPTGDVRESRQGSDYMSVWEGIWMLNKIELQQGVTGAKEVDTGVR